VADAVLAGAVGGGGGPLRPAGGVAERLTGGGHRCGRGGGAAAPGVVAAVVEEQRVRVAVQADQGHTRVGDVGAELGALGVVPGPRVVRGRPGAGGLDPGSVAEPDDRLTVGGGGV